MKRLLAAPPTLLLLTTIALGLGMAGAAKEPPHFVPPNVLKAGPLPYPASSLDAGVVTLSINLDNAGQIASVGILRDLSSVSGLAMTTVHSWTFTPATLEGKPVPSSLVVNILYDPGFLGADNIPLQPPSQTTPITKNSPPYLPAQLSAASFAPYPAKAKKQDTVVLNVSINAAGNLSNIATLRDVPPLTASALTTVKKWSFSAATYDGNPIASTMVVAIVFHSPNAPIPQ
ncbi:MAG TPA: energy transducer TonB [Candidatus Acidoferrum sp.]|nr:energy transducer TonB [Candidatus Acidoferrum sp.]